MRQEVNHPGITLQVVAEVSGIVDDPLQVVNAGFGNRRCRNRA